MTEQATEIPKAENSKKLYQVDAFSEVPFQGNPAGVYLSEVPLSELSEEWMQKVAMEMNLSETAFVGPLVREAELPQKASQQDYEIRYFTPTQEVPLCGHATLASAHVMYELDRCSRKMPITFMAKGGRLTARWSRPQDSIAMKLPLSIPVSLEESFGDNTQDAFALRETLSRCFAGPLSEAVLQQALLYKRDPWLIVVLPEEGQVVDAQMNMDVMRRELPFHLLVTAPGASEELDYVLRCFAPAAGIPEDPVTGSAQCILAPLWGASLGKSDMVSRQVSSRGGDVYVTVLQDQVEVQGKAVTVFSLDLLI